MPDSTHTQPLVSPASSLERLPKVLLHDHFDGGLRPATVIELALEQGYKDLPTYDPEDLASWFHRGADRRSLELYLETFIHTVAVLRTPEAIERVAYETGEDLAIDGVIYAESRFAPQLVATDNGPTLDASIAAMDRGFAAAHRAFGIDVRTIVVSMRNFSLSTEVARAAIRNRDKRVVGFDIAGPEVGFPPEAHLEAFQICRAGGLGITIHAGEADGVESIRSAVVTCDADRIGHGVRIIDDISISDDGTATLGPVATLVRDSAIVLEVCPTSNLHTGAAGITEFDQHPIDRLLHLGFAVTVNTDNRLMSDVTLSSEYQALNDAFGWEDDTFTSTNYSAIESAFCDSETKVSVAARLALGARYSDRQSER